MNSEAIKNRINNAGTLNAIGLFGILFPIVGVISSGVALRSMNKLLEQITETQLTDKLKREIQHRKITAIVIIILCLLSGILWFIGTSLANTEPTQPYMVTETIESPQQAATPALEKRPESCISQTNNDQLTGNSYTYTTCN